jgi:hypothetical protein
MKENFKIDIDDFDLDMDLDLEFDTDFLNKNKNRYTNPTKEGRIKAKNIHFGNAQELAHNINLKKEERVNIILGGNFIMGDFIEAFFIDKNIKAKELTISTLSMSQNNVDSLKNLLVGKYIERINLIISEYFFAHERNKLIKYMLSELDMNNSFQLAVDRNHTKICLFETLGGKKIVIHGSANLRSAGCAEQISIEENKKLFNFYNKYHKEILQKFSIINKKVRR